MELLRPIGFGLTLLPGGSRALWITIDWLRQSRDRLFALFPSSLPACSAWLTPFSIGIALFFSLLLGGVSERGKDVLSVDSDSITALSCFRINAGDFDRGLPADGDFDRRRVDVDTTVTCPGDFERARPDDLDRAAGVRLATGDLGRETGVGVAEKNPLLPRGSSAHVSVSIVLLLWFNLIIVVEGLTLCMYSSRRSPACSSFAFIPIGLLSFDLGLSVSFSLLSLENSESVSFKSSASPFIVFNISSSEPSNLLSATSSEFSLSFSSGSFSSLAGLGSAEPSTQLLISSAIDINEKELSVTRDELRSDCCLASDSPSTFSFSGNFRPFCNSLASRFAICSSFADNDFSSSQMQFSCAIDNASYLSRIFSRCSRS